MPEEVVPSPEVVLETTIGVLARGVLGVPGLDADVPTTLGEQALTTVPGVLALGVVGLCPEVAPTFGEPVLGPVAVRLGVVALGVVEGLVNLCAALETVPGVLARGAAEVANLGPCPELATTLGELVRTPEGPVNLCAVLVTVDDVLAPGVDV